VQHCSYFLLANIATASWQACLNSIFDAYLLNQGVFWRHNKICLDPTNCLSNSTIFV
jgi:hypothetical protein